MSTDCIKNDRLKNLYQLIIKENEGNATDKSDTRKCLEEFFDETLPEVPSTPTEKTSLYTKHSKTINAMKNMFTLKSSKSLDNTTMSRKDKRKQIRSISSGNMSSLFASNHKKTLSLEEIRCVLSNILIKSDESGYGSDSTRTSSDSPCGSIKSQTNPQTSTPNNQTTPTSIAEESPEDNTLVNVSAPDENTLIESNEIEVTVNEKRDCSTFTPTCDDDTDSADDDIFLETRKKPRKMKAQIRRTPSAHTKAKNIRNDQSFLRKRNLTSVMKKAENVKKCDPITMEEFFSNSNYSPISTGLKLRTDGARTNPLSLRSDVTTTPVLSRQSIFDKEYKCIHLKLNDEEDTGIIIHKKDESVANSPYVIVNIIPGMPADRYECRRARFERRLIRIFSRNGKFQMGDEIVKVNDVRLRGLSYLNAITALRPGSVNNLEIIIGRITSVDKTPRTKPHVDEYSLKYKPSHESNRTPLTLPSQYARTSQVNNIYIKNPSSHATPDRYSSCTSVSSNSVTPVHYKSPTDYPSTSSISLMNDLILSDLNKKSNYDEDMLVRMRKATGNEPKIIKETYKNTVKLSDLDNIKNDSTIASSSFPPVYNPDYSTPVENKDRILTGMRKFSIQHDHHLLMPRRQSAVVANSVPVDE